MKAASRIDLTAQTASQLIQSFEIKLSNSEVLLWEKPAQVQGAADRAIPKFLFPEEVLKELEKSNS